MKVYFFYALDNDSNWWKGKLHAITEITVWSNLNNRYQSSFTYIEEIDMMIHKNRPDYQVSKFTIEHGKDGCHGHSATNYAELLKANLDYSKWYDLKPCTRLQYERLRKIFFEIYKGEMHMNFDLIEAKEAPKSVVIL